MSEPPDEDVQPPTPIRVVKQWPKEGPWTVERYVEWIEAGMPELE